MLEPLTGIGTDLQHDKAARAADLDAKREQAERVRWRIASVVRAGAPAR